MSWAFGNVGRSCSSLGWPLACPGEFMPGESWVLACSEAWGESWRCESARGCAVGMPSWAGLCRSPGAWPLNTVPKLSACWLGGPGAGAVPGGCWRVGKQVSSCRCECPSAFSLCGVHRGSSACRRPAVCPATARGQSAPFQRGGPGQCPNSGHPCGPYRPARPRQDLGSGPR